jgi:hypothetical protein
VREPTFIYRHRSLTVVGNAKTIKKAPITSIRGHDETDLAEFPAEKGHEVSRSASAPTDTNDLLRVIREVQPDETYNVAEQPSSDVV